MNRAFARLWTASLFSEIAEWMLQVALPVFIYQATGSAGSTALTMAVGILPMVLLSPVAGIVADRWDRRRTLWIVCLAQAAVAVPLLVIGDALALIYVVMAAQSTVASLFEPARSALVPEVVRPDRLVAANGLMGFNSSIARLLGSALGGLVLGFGGLTSVILVYLGALVIAALLLLPRFETSPRVVSRQPMSWLDGLREFGGGLRFTGMSLVSSSLSQGMFMVLFVVFVTGPLGGGEAEVGLLRGIQAIGGLAAGAVIASVARRVAPGAMLGFGAISLGVLSFITWYMPNVTMADTVYIVLFAATGAPAVFYSSGLLTVLQTAGGPARSGQIVAAAMAGMSAFQVVGMLAAGALVDVWGLTVLLYIQAALRITAGVATLLDPLYRRPVAPRPPDRESSASTRPVSPGRSR
ncbi:MFS family permease [Kibdelosporangium banguiense]|uniref:MFS family permease n=1 Tax=Kibdelosporangium banguiense TaxID=1365924 RepID=A0ABS4TNZ5_9PSEU|nr:MFS transporter [Kibdelosporangium banguiense]MBP2326122.1 MFS family permease [Kibdelosporangium banguiense]